MIVHGWHGRVLAIHGVVRSSSSVWINGHHSVSYILTDGTDDRAYGGSFPTAPKLLCFVAAETPGADVGAHVVAVGTVKEWNFTGEIALQDCVLSR